MILGALLWPSVAKLIGQSLGRLPSSWGGDRIRKWLPTQLARNVAGGLMLVVVKVCNIALLSNCRATPIISQHPSINPQNYSAPPPPEPISETKRMADSYRTSSLCTANISVRSDSAADR